MDANKTLSSSKNKSDSIIIPVYAIIDTVQTSGRLSRPDKNNHRDKLVYTKENDI